MLADSTDGRCGRPGAHHDQRPVALRQLVAGRAQRRDVRGLHVLHLVDEQRDPDAEVSGHRGGVGQQLGQVDLQVARVGPAAHGRDVDAQLGDDRALGAAGVAGGERLEHAQEVIDPVRRPVPGRQLADGHVQRAGDRPPDRLLGPGLDLAGAPQPLHRHRPEGVQQHGLADAAQPGQHHAALRPAAGDPLQHDLELGDLTVTAGQLGRPLSGARRVRISHGVHAIGAYAGSSKIPRLA